MMENKFESLVELNIHVAEVKRIEEEKKALKAKEEFEKTLALEKFIKNTLIDSRKEGDIIYLTTKCDVEVNEDLFKPYIGTIFGQYFKSTDGNKYLVGLRMIEFTLEKEGPVFKCIRPHDKCQSCYKNGSAKLHTCPYQSDVNGDVKTKCNCCNDCEKQCCDEI